MKKASILGSLSELTEGIKDAADSAIKTFNESVNQEKKYSSEQLNNQTETALQEAKFCSNCGNRIVGDVKFCSECGMPINDVKDEPKNSNAREKVFSGKILKCPNCGATITQTTAICEECGYRITGKEAVGSVRTFSEQLMAIESSRKKASVFSGMGISVDPADQKKLSLIRSFPIPNTIDDILEFMMLAIANIDVGLSKNTMINSISNKGKSGENSMTIARTISDAWVSKMRQAYQKAEISFPNDSAFDNMKKMYFEKMKELKIKVD